ncbi:MAG: hypothetical protein ISR65_05550 [Bacteriovoracaceae bacterium]|nr:hypothetical protein [Bacteriovoracaceae bacterium]
MQLKNLSVIDKRYLGLSTLVVLLVSILLLAEQLLFSEFYDFTDAISSRRVKVAVQLPSIRFFGDKRDVPRKKIVKLHVPKAKPKDKKATVPEIKTAPVVVPKPAPVVEPTAEPAVMPDAPLQIPPQQNLTMVPYGLEATSNGMAVMSSVSLENISVGKEFIFLKGEKMSPITFGWEPIESAYRYVIEISTDSGFKRIVIRKKLKQNLFVLKPKRYLNKRLFWRVRSMSRSKKSAWSKKKTIKLKSVDL